VAFVLGHSHLALHGKSSGEGRGKNRPSIMPGTHPERVETRREKVRPTLHACRFAGEKGRNRKKKTEYPGQIAWEEES